MSEDEDDYEFSLGESQDSEIPGGKDELFGEMAKQLAEPGKDTLIDSSSESESDEESAAEAKHSPPSFTAAANKTTYSEEESSSDEEVVAAQDKPLDSNTHK